jgi:hypothetical protein
MLTRPSSGVNFNTTYAGSTLNNAGTQGYFGGALSGTWRCLGYTVNGDGATLFIRIS